MSFSFSEMLFLFLLALIVFGPKRLPEIGRHLGKALAEFRRASNEFKAQLESEMHQIEMDEMLNRTKEHAGPTILPPKQRTAGRQRSGDVAFRTARDLTGSHRRPVPGSARHAEPVCLRRVSNTNSKPHAAGSRKRWAA